MESCKNSQPLRKELFSENQLPDEKLSFATRLKNPENKHQLEEMGMNGRQFIEKNYNRAKIIEKYLMIIDKIITQIVN